MASTQDILRALADYERTPESYGLGLRLDLAELAIGRLNATGQTIPELARETGLTENYLSGVLYSDVDCTLGDVGRILFALRISASLRSGATEPPTGDHGSKETI